MRPFHRDDVAAIADVLGRPEVMRFSLHGPYSLPQSSAFVDRCVESYRTRGFGLWAVVPKGQASVMGYCGLCLQVIDGREDVEIGYRLHPQLWGQGLATEAAAIVLEYAFETLKLERVIACIDAENVSSIRVAEKIGLTYAQDSLFQGQIPVRVYVREATRSTRRNA